jgi:hypothetical protein
MKAFTTILCVWAALIGCNHAAEARESLRYDFFANRICRLPQNSRVAETWLEADYLEARGGLYIWPCPDIVGYQKVSV